MTPVPYPTGIDGLYDRTAVECPNCATGAKVVSSIWTGCGHCWGRRDGKAFATDSIFAFFGQTPSKEVAPNASVSP